MLYMFLMSKNILINKLLILCYKINFCYLRKKDNIRNPHAVQNWYLTFRAWCIRLYQQVAGWSIKMLQEKADCCFLQPG